MSYRRCTRCVMDNISDDTISFDSDGRCNYCCDIEKRLPNEYFPGDDGKEKLQDIIRQIKEDSVDNEFDCLIGISGGIDSSYLMYLGYKYGLRMLTVHVDDGLDNPIATRNIEKLVKKTGSEYVVIKPNIKQYADVIYSLLKASVSNLAICQDNMIIKSVRDYADKHKIKYLIEGSNFAHESILERSKGGVNSGDSKYIKGVHRRFGRIPINDLDLMTLTEMYLSKRTNSRYKRVRLLNYIDYNLEEAIHTLENFCGFEYYGGKHYESILTRYMQCYYLPEKFGIDKRKSHFSSLIMSNQMTREEALEKLQEPLYISSEMYNADRNFLAGYLDISVDELQELVNQSPRKEKEYPHSILNNLAPIARKFRKILE